MRTLIKSILIASLLLAVWIPAASANQETTYFFDNEIFEFSTAPIIQKGITYVPARSLLEKFELTVTWNKNTRSIDAKNDDFTIVLKPGSQTAVVNEEEFALNAVPQVNKGAAWVPLRGVLKIFEYDVIADKVFGVVSIAPLKEQSLFAVLLHLSFVESQSLDNIVKSLDSNSWEYKNLVDTLTTEIETKYIYDLDDIGVLELIDGQAEVGVTLVRTTEGEAPVTTTTSYVYQVKKQKNGVWRIYNILPGTEADPPVENPA